VRVSPVRDLARRYASGQLSQENYRAQRRVLIDAITADAQPLTYREERIPAFGKHGRMKIALAGAVVMLVAVIFGLVWKTTAAKHAATTTHTAAAPPTSDPGQELVHGFVETNDWTDPSLLDFLQRWQALSSASQKQAKGGPDFAMLASGLRQQLTSEKALAKLAVPTNTDLHLVNLQKMADLLGLSGKN